MNDKIRIFSLGGLDESGKNCIVVEVNDDLFVVGCGIAFPDKTMPGIDYVIPNYEFLKANKERVKAYFLPHGHDDEISALAYVYRDVPAPIYGSKVSIAMLKMFARHVGIPTNDFEFHPVEATSRFAVAGRNISFFHTSHNIADSSGIAIGTTLGNIVITSDFVVENNASASYLHDMNAIAKIAELPTLALLAESEYADRLGYTAPHYKMMPLVDETVKNAEGRLFVSIFSTNFYNIDEAIQIAKKTNRKIIPYDRETEEMLAEMQGCGQLLIPRDNAASLDDINRMRDRDIMVLIVGFGPKLYNKVALLAAGQNEEKRVKLKTTDTVVLASPSNNNTELEATDALDELYRTGCNVKHLKRKEFLRMHASEEDLKMMISLLKPRYYVPVKGYFKDLLANAEVALSMNVGLNHGNVFLLENGLTLQIDATGAKIVQEDIPHGDIMIDGTGVGDVGQSVLDDREKLSQGVVIMAATVSAKERRIIGGVDVQIRGLVYLKDSDALVREMTRLFTSMLDDLLADPTVTIESIKDAIYDRCSYQLRRMSGKEPMVLPLIITLP